MNLDELITAIKDIDNSRSLSDDFLKQRGCRTRDDVGIGEYIYGIVMCPVDFVLPYLEELKKIRDK